MIIFCWILIGAVHAAFCYQARIIYADTISTNDLQGCWTTEGIKYESKNCGNLAKESGPLLEIRNWVIKGDTIWVFRFPCQYYEKWKFHIKSDTIYREGWRKSFARVSKENNKLKFTFRNCEVAYFTRDTFDIKTIELLKRDSFNPECVLEKMKIVTHFVPDDGAAFDAIPPIAMPKQIVIRNTDSATVLLKKHRITLNIKGKKRAFYVRQIEWDNVDWDEENGNPDWRNRFFIYISPAEWWTGEPFEVKYVEE